jgi:hypothetical protein
MDNVPIDATVSNLDWEQHTTQEHTGPQFRQSLAGSSNPATPNMSDNSRGYDEARSTL